MEGGVDAEKVPNKTGDRLELVAITVGFRQLCLVPFSTTDPTDKKETRLHSHVH